MMERIFFEKGGIENDGENIFWKKGGIGNDGDNKISRKRMYKK